MQSLSDSGPMPPGDGQPATGLFILTSGGDDGGDLDYSALLHSQDLSHFISGSSFQPATSPTSAAPALATQASGPLQLAAPQPRPLAPSTALTPRSPFRDVSDWRPVYGAQPQQRQRLERRGHTKSRKGCFNCKRRRIKCQETRPACGHCVKQGLECEYPSLPSIVHQPHHQVPLFSLQDMRLFQHFLLNCYPHHPIGSEELWTHEIPCLAEKYEYLMHAILGYSASELMVSSDPSLAEAAMSHRLKAIKAIKKALSAPGQSSASTTLPSFRSSSSSSSSDNNGNKKKKRKRSTPDSSSPPAASPPLSPSLPLPPAPPPRPSTTDPLFEEGNALMAACFALTYQSVLLPDGMAEFMTFARGVPIVAIQMHCRGARMLFGHLLGERQRDVLRPHMECLPLVDADWAARAVRSVEGLAPLVEGLEVEGRYWALLREMAGMLTVCSWKAYLGLTEHYTWWMLLPHEQFQRLVDPANQAAVVLGAHWKALEEVMATICDAERKAAAKLPDKAPSSGAGLTTVRWLAYLIGQVDAEHRAYMQFPVWVQAQLDRDPAFFGRTF